MLDVIKKAEETHSLNKDELVLLLKEDKFDKEIFEAADRVRKKYVGDEVHLRGLIEFSNICKQNCLYCGLRRDNKNVERYRLSEEQIINFAKNARNLGYRTVVLQSGEDDYFNVDRMTRILRAIKNLILQLP